MQKLLKIIHFPNWLTILLAIVLILRIPSFFEPYSYGDEMIYLTLGEGVRQGVPLYKELHDNKPPLLYLTAAVAGSLFWFKVILAGWSLVTIVLFWKLAKVLFPGKKRLHKISVTIFAILTTIPLLEGNIANAENFMIGFTIAGFLLLLSLPKKTTRKTLQKIFFSGLLFSIAALFKIPAAFDLLAIIIFWIITANKLNKETIKNIVLKTLLLGAGFLVPIGLTFLWYTARGAFSEYLIAAYLQNFGYLSSFRPGDIKEPFLVKNLPLLIRGGVVLVGIALVTFFRKKLSKQFIFLSLWLLLSLFAITLSERPYPHYLLQAVPTISFFIGLLITLPNLEQSLAIIPLSLAFLVPVYYKFWHYPTGSYYVRFIKLATKTISTDEYLKTFGEHIPRNYNIAKIIRSSTKRSDRIFVWGDTSLVYALSRRLPPIKYVADYHINDFGNRETVIEQLETDMPKLIIIQPNSPRFSELMALLRENYILINNFDGAEIWMRLSQEIKRQLLHSNL